MDRSHSRQMVRFGGCLLMLAALALCAPGARAQLTATQTETHTVVPPPPSLAAVLAASPPPGVVMAVDAENTFRPPDRALPEPGASTERVGWAFDRLVKSFGRVTALAPPTMVVLNTHPTGENIYQGMPAPQVFELLLASLDEAGWDAITGVGGLGMDNLQTADQRAMFMALFPAGSLRVVPEMRWDPSKDEPRDIHASEIARSRVRLAKEIIMMLPIAGESDRAMGTSGQVKPGAPRRYQIVSTGPAREKTRAFVGVLIRAEVPNAPKPGQLNLKDGRFNATIPVAEIHSVGDLVERIGRQTHTELYADPRLERLSLTLPGKDRAAVARDLLRAVMLCVAGTLRNVGPAFVLTDDVIGIATRREILNRFIARVKAERAAAVQPAEGRLRTLSQRILALNYSPDSLTMSPDEAKYEVKGPGSFGNALVTLKAPLAALTPDQQDLARRMAESVNGDADRAVSTGDLPSPEKAPKPLRVSLDGNIDVLSQPTAQLDIPGLDGPVDLGVTVGASNLATLTHTARVPPSTARPLVPGSGPAAAGLLARFHRRVCLAAPDSLKELDSILDEMLRAGLNELWLVAPAPGAVPRKGESATAGALVDEAVRAGGPKAIAVLPTLDLLTWGSTVPAADVDYNLLGETSMQSMALMWRDFLTTHPDSAGIAPITALTTLDVSPFAPGVQTALIGLENEVVKPGIGGLVWRNIAPPGYHRFEEQYKFDFTTELGYQNDGRLLFLRRFHADPVDIVMEARQDDDVDESLPNFEDAAINTGLREQWRDFRIQGELLLLQSVCGALGSPGSGSHGAQATAPSVVVEAPGSVDNIYMEWDNRRQVPYMPGLRSQMDLITSVRSQTRHALTGVPHRELEDPEQLVISLSSASTQPVWDGVVLDLTPTPASAGVPARSSLENLRRLSRMLHPAS